MRADGHIIHGVLTGTVAGDPDELGRVPVEYEWMEGESTTEPAPIASFMSGGGRGSWFMPEKGDEVLVAFNQGRFDEPIIIGFLWNGESKPPNEDVDKSVRRIQTVSGHRMDFHDTGGGERVEVTSSSGHTMVLDDGGSKVALNSSAGHQVTLDDAPGGSKVALKSSTGHSVTLDDTTQTISITSTGGMKIEIDSLGQITLHAPLGVNVRTLLATFSGIIEAKAIRAQLGKFEAVVCPAHAPGWGTTLP